METKKKQDISGMQKLKSFFNSVAENVKEGAEVVTEKIKDNSAKVYVAGSELIEETNERIHKYSDKVSIEKEIKNIKAKQELIVKQFGAVTLKHYITNGSLHKAFLTNETIEKLVEEYKINTKDLKSLERKLKSLK